MEIEDFINQQIEQWPLAASNYAALQSVTAKDLPGGMRVQHNPARIASTGVKVDSASIAARPCFLCRANRPFLQKSLEWGDYEILVNPYPIFLCHLTIATKKHTRQSIVGRVKDMARLAFELHNFTVLFNGAHCGASAPDHMHFQVVPTGCLPIWAAIPDLQDDKLSACEPFKNMGVIALRTSPEKCEEALTRVIRRCPDINLLMRADGDNVVALLIPRKAHRPSFYGSGPGQMLISPASVDLAGVFIAPRREDFDRIDDDTISGTLAEVCFSVGEVEKMLGATVSVGILSDSKIRLRLHGNFYLDGDLISGLVEVAARNVKDDLVFIPADNDSFTEVEDVTIGVNFHWQRKECQCFRSAMRITKHNGQLTLINDIDIEDYLTSVISSEMNATSSLELLKAHAVISRSWVLAQINHHKAQNAPQHPSTVHNSAVALVPQHIKWYDHDDHDIFDVCADDHCQRYQGITRASTPAVIEAINATRGLVLTCEGALCDARFSKCCGGMLERFESCWEDVPHPYLVPVRDAAAEDDVPDLTVEDNARRWILSQPDAFCNTANPDTLRQILNNYDSDSTPDFFRWTVEYDTDTLSELISRKSGIDFGRIIDLVPLERGASGRIVRLRVIGENTTADIGKELEIRRCLSESHLYSSAFVVDRKPDGFVLHGAGWGHGVGLCQIGAAVMAAKGYTYRQILAHYYPNTQISDYTSIAK